MPAPCPDPGASVVPRIICPGRQRSQFFGGGPEQRGTGLRATVWTTEQGTSVSDSPTRGEVWLVRLPRAVGVEMQRDRPAVVVNSPAATRLPFAAWCWSGRR